MTDKRELFDEQLEKNHYLTDGGKAHLHTEQAGFFAGTERTPTVLLRSYSVSEGDDYLLAHKRSEYKVKPVEPIILPEPEFTQSGPKGWVKALSLFGKKSEAPKEAPKLEVHRDKTPTPRGPGA